MNNSTLIKSYENIMAQYERDFDGKNNLIREMERELQQIQYENQSLTSQLYNLKVNMQQSSTHNNIGNNNGNNPTIMMGNTTGANENNISGGLLFREAGGIGRDEKERLVELLKRNHDIVLEKYELQKSRNDGLEKTAIEKEKLYNEIKIEND